MNSLNLRTQTQFSDECREIDTSKLYSVLRDLMLYHNIRPYELAFALSLPEKTVIQLLRNGGCRPKFSTLLKLARFFEITLQKLLGEEPIEYRGRPSDTFSFGICKFRLYLDCCEYAVYLLEKNRVKLSSKRVTRMIQDLYRYSLSSKKASVDEAFAKWCMARYAKKRHG